MNRILIVEDEPSILMALEDDLTREGYVVLTAADGQTGLRTAKREQPDLIMLDVMLPGMDGFEVCRRIREEGLRMPILMLTAKSQEVDKVLGLELGADDYVTKPFSPREIQARVKALLRRVRLGAGSDLAEEVDWFQFGEVEVDFRKYEACKCGEVVGLTRQEFELLRYLIRHRDGAVSRFDILQDVWGSPGTVFQRTVDTHVANLRRKLESDPSRPRHIVSVRGVGYRFAE